MGTWDRLLLGGDDCGSPNIVQSDYTSGADITSANTCNTPNIVQSDYTTGADVTGDNTCDTPNLVQTTITGNSGTVTNGVYTTGTQTIGGAKTFSSVVKVPAGTEASPGLQITDANNGIFDSTGLNFVVNNVLEFKMADGGNFHADGDIIAYSTTTSSDKRLKKEIAPFKRGLDDILKLNPVTYHWRDESRNKNQYKDIGFIAQEVQEVMPNIVSEVESVGSTLRNDGMPTHLTIAYTKIIPGLVNSIKELNEKITDLEHTVYDRPKLDEEK